MQEEVPERHHARSPRACIPHITQDNPASRSGRASGPRLGNPILESSTPRTLAVVRNAGIRFEPAGPVMAATASGEVGSGAREHGSIVCIAQVAFRDSSYESVQLRGTLCDRELYGPQRGSDHSKCALALDVAVISRGPEE